MSPDDPVGDAGGEAEPVSDGQGPSDIVLADADLFRAEADAEPFDDSIFLNEESANFNDRPVADERPADFRAAADAGASGVGAVGTADASLDASDASVGAEVLPLSLQETNRALEAPSGGAAVHDSQAARPGEPAVELLPRPEVATTKLLYLPGESVPVRLTLVNPHDAPAELALGAGGVPAEDGIGLPASLVFGTEQAPALYLAYEDEPAVAIRRGDGVAAAGPSNSSENVRIAPRGIVGMELDLTALHRGLRYSGEYRLEWRPAGGRLGAAAVVFRVEQRQSVVITTDQGRMTFVLDYESAPQNVAAFLELARSEFYDKTTFHRLEPDFIIQGGCPHGTGRGMRPDGKTVPLEASARPFERGTLAMAHKPDDVNSASSQFFICLNRVDFEERYTIIGHVVNDESFRTLEKLNALKTENKKPTRPIRMTVRLVPESRVIERGEFSAQPPP